MVNVINKMVGYVANPLALGMLIVMTGLTLVLLKKRKAAVWALCAALAWFWFWSMPIVGGWLVLPLEEDYPVRLAEDMPKADAIAIMGGGVWGTTNYPYASLKDGADRAWHAARLWKAGKAPIIIPSNIGAEFADVKLLVDLGVPRDAVILENKAVNTEENAKFVGEILLGSGGVKSGGVGELVRGGVGGSTSPTSKPTVLLVTSALHMRRAMYMFEKYAPNVNCIPAATNYLALPWKGDSFRWRSLLPSIDAFARNNSFIHEYVGYYGYKWFR